jgi:hypothetical protein
MRIGELISNHLGQDVGTEPKVDEAGASDLGRLGQVRNLELGNELGGNLTRWLAFTIGQAQCHIRLVMAELRSGGRPELGIDTGDGFDPGA